MFRQQHRQNKPTDLSGTKKARKKGENEAFAYSKMSRETKTKRERSREGGQSKYRHYHKGSRNRNNESGNERAKRFQHQGVNQLSEGSDISRSLVAERVGETA